MRTDIATTKPKQPKGQFDENRMDHHHFSSKKYNFAKAKAYPLVVDTTRDSRMDSTAHFSKGGLVSAFYVKFL